MFKGEVTAIFTVGGLYNIIVRHGSYMSVYCNLSSTSVRRGQNVQAGQTRHGGYRCLGQQHTALPAAQGNGPPQPLRLGSEDNHNACQHYTFNSKHYTTMKIEQQLTNAVIEAVKALYGQDITAAQVALQKTKKEFEGHLTLVVFGLLRISHKKPEDTAQEIGQWLKDNTTLLQGFNVVKGFLNLVIAPAQWIGLLNDIDANAEYGITHPTADSPLVMIEYSSPNTNKPLHLGHVRNNLLGWALAGVIEANGNRVVKTNIVNDRGIHICKSMLAWLKYGNGETPESSGKKGDHLIGDYYVVLTALPCRGEGAAG